MADLRDNKHLYVFPTEAGFGAEGDLARVQAAGLENPLLADSGVRWGGKPVMVNDLFRGVHDVFGHFKEGVGFRASGEENAWRSHSAMYSPEARKAMTSETRGQNSWVNYGPHAEHNRTADQLETVYAEQKTGILPQWVIDEGANDLPPGSTRTPPGALHQTRENELKGAVQFLNSEDGQRILYMTQQADVSTILHELIGHGVREMKFHYPDEFADVERMIGRPLHEWTVDDHERFARMVERYFESGKAPIPELVDTFAHLQVWMRAVRSEAERRVPVAPEVSTLLDNYLGAYDDATVFRVATVATRIPTDVTVGARQAVYEFTGAELAALRRRNDARAYKNSIEKLEQDTRRLSAIENRTPEQEDRLIELIGQLREMQGERQIQIVDRENNLRARYKEIETALATPTQDGYDVALDNLKTLITMREDILRSVFGDKYDTTFENRVDLLADYLADEGLIPPGFTRGTAFFVPHRPVGGGKLPRRVDVPARALESPVIGKTDTSLLGLNRRNNLIRWQNGDIEADPLVVFEAWQNAQSFAFVDQIKKLMWDIGTPIDPLHPIPANIYIINRKGIPIPSLIRRQMPPGTSNDVQRAVDAIEGRNPDAMVKTLERYIGDIIMDPAGAAELIRQVDTDFAQLELRAVDKKIIDAIFRPLRGGGGGIGRAFDLTNALARWSMIYSNPAYVPFNLIANGIFLGAQGGPMAIYDAVSAARFLIRDKKMQIRVGGQVGHIQAQAMAQTGRGLERFSAAEQKWLNRITALPDRWPRMVAWVAEARRMGYKTKADMNRLLDGETPTTARAREKVSDRATSIMVDFDRMSDWERQNITRFLFIWPWIRGATAWPFYYMREYPVASAVGLNIGAATEARRQRIMGDTRAYYREDFPVSKKGHFVQETNLGSISPTSTAAQVLEATIGNLESLFGHGNVEAGGRLIDFVQPIYELLAHAALGVSGTGKAQPLGSTLFDDILQFVPTGGPFWRQIYDPSKRSKVYNQRGSWDVAERRFLRIPVQTVDLYRLDAFNKSQGQKTGEEAVRATVVDLNKQAKAVNMGGPPMEVVRALRIQQAIRDERARRQKELGDIPGRYQRGGGAKLTESEEAMVIYNVLLTFYPFQYRQAASPMEVGKHVRLMYADALLYGSKDAGIPSETAPLHPLTTYRSELAKKKREKKLVGGGF